MKRIAPFVWLAYLLVPVEGWGLLHGRPLGGLEVVVLLAGAWLWWWRGTLPAGALAIVALVAKLGLGALWMAPHGFSAQYFAKADFSGARERGTEPADAGSTRTDPQLAFGGGADVDLPVYFFNDIQRFNFYLPTDPDRVTLPVSVKWDGWIDAPTDTARRLFVRGAKGQAVVAIGNEPPVTVELAPTPWTGFVRLKAGLQPIRVTLSMPQGAARDFAAGWMVNDVERPFGPSVYRKHIPPARIVTDAWLRRVSVVWDALLLLGLAAAFARAVFDVARRTVRSPGVREALALLWVLAAVDAVRVSGIWINRMMTLSGGDDWLSYETLARDIGLNGLWMLKGAELGHGQPFYFQPLYPYFVAATHWVFGDGLFGVLLVQRWLIGAAVVALWRLTAALFGERVGIAGLLAGAAVIYVKLAPIAGLVLNELLYVPLLCLWALMLVRLARSDRPTLPAAIAAGVVGGLATLARSPLMLGWALVVPCILIAAWRTRRAVRTVSALVLVLVAVTGLATYRNWRVSGTAVLVSSSGAINFYLGNQPPMRITIPPERTALYNRWGVDDNVRVSLEFARQQPRAFFEGWRKKALFTLGWHDILDASLGRSSFFIAVWILALLGVVVVIARPSWLPSSGAAFGIPTALAIAHFAVLVIVFPTQGDRLLVPFYLMLVPAVAVALDAVWMLLRGGRRGRIPAAGKASA